MGKGIGDDLRQVGVVTKYELYKHLRSKRLFVFIGLAALMIILITVLFLYNGMPDDPTEFILWYATPVNLLVIVGVSLFCAPAIASEFEERTALLIFPRPMRKISFLTGKMLACYIMCGLVIVLYYVICMIMSLIFSTGLDMNVLGSLGLALLFMLGAGGFAFLVSSLFKKGSTSIVITIATLLLIFSIIDMMYMAFVGEPFFSITYAAGDITAIIKDTLNFGMFTIDLDHLGARAATVVMLAWFAVTTALAAFFFQRREF
ncbi:MAG: ABC transporter permease [Methanomassiliicoccaceae archaeon]|jgi:ABC-2 type transport system permease protein|nr:ABC transporter permease [Methanomassiliicoccaceae archaeon]